jgi:hypothetical protein
MRAVCAVERAVLVVLCPDLRPVLECAVALPDLCVAVEDVFFFFFAVVVLVLLLLVVLWPEAAYDAEAARAAARINAPRKRTGIGREVGEFCALIYPL